MMSGLNRSPSLSSSNSQIFMCFEHMNNISEKLESFYQKNEFSDIVLVAAIDNFEVHAHKIILSAASEYFFAMFRSSLIEANANKIVLKEIDGITLKLITDFMYTATIELRSETIESILRAADFFQINTLKRECCRLMAEQLDVGNCLGITLFAEQHQHITLHKESLAFVLRNFQQVQTEKEFLMLNAEQLSKIIADDNLCAISEEIVFLSIVAWVEHDKANREHLMSNLLSNVRFWLIKPEFIAENRHCSYELMGSWLECNSSCSPQSIEHSKSRQQSEKLIFVCINIAGKFCVQSYNSKLKKWVQEQELPVLLTSPEINYKMIAVGNKFIIAGNLLGNSRQIHSLACLDPITNSSTDLPRMSIVRTGAEMAELNGCVYFVGGLTKEMTLTSAVERYDISLGVWQNVASWPSHPQPLKLAVVGELLYAIGYDQMYCYNPATDKWTLKQFKSVKLDDFSITGLNGYLYAVGGMCNGTTSQIVERYDPTQDTWAVVSSLRVGYAHLLCTGFNNRLVACWGHDGRRRINLVQEYDPAADEWRTLAPLLKESDMLEVECSHLFVLKG